ncbi:proton-coupled folate transporter-like [Saccoglossus kowalevskii]
MYWVGNAATSEELEIRLGTMGETVKIMDSSSEVEPLISRGIKLRRIDRCVTVEPAESSYWVLYLDASGYLLSFFSGPVIGSLGDHVGRKVAIIIPCLGLVCYSGICVLVVYLQLPLGYLFLAEIIRGLTGHIFTGMSGFLAYIADITTLQQRTYRVVIVTVVILASSALGQVGVGFWLESQGFGPPLILVFLLYILTICYVIVFIKETIIYDSSKSFTLVIILKGVGDFLKYNTDGRRWKFILLVGDIIFLTLIVSSSLSLVVLYVQDYPFCWNSVFIGLYFAAQLSFSGLGMIVGGKLLPRWLSDSGMVHVGIVSFIAMMLINAFAYHYPVIMFVGVMFCCTGCADSLAMCVSPIIFNTIYAETIAVFPGLVYIVMAIVLIVPVILTIIIQVKESKTGYRTLEAKDI